ncbi:PAS domain S-box protein [Bacillus timonensis]|uniref:PAS domain S-box protein n=1 Tax=Bacillus timonensis TaxID=1033734 RepID=A0A4S3PP46_9BACI|nr:PAS domain S-box protein [Bacillus timonensis]THE10935.1 PAS domain S-box protein [Bacillus timonensis]
MNLIKMFEQKGFSDVINLVASAFNSLKDILYIIHVDQFDFTYMYANQAGLSVLNTDQSLFGKQMEEFLPKERALFLKPLYEKAAHSKRIVTFEEEITLSNGQVIINETVLTPIDDGEHQYIVAIVRDVTEKTLRLQELQQSKRKLEENKLMLDSLITNNDDAVLMLDTAGIFHEINQAAEKIIGYQPSELIGTHFSKLMTQKEYEKIQMIEQQVTQGETFRYETKIYHKNGNEIYVDVKNIPITIEGTLTGLYGIVKDITSNKRAEQARRESEETFRIIAENSVDIIKVINPEGKITYISPSVEDILGYPVKKRVNESLFDTVHPDDFEKIRDIFKNLIETKEHVDIEVRRKHLDGHFVWLHSDLIPVLDSEGELEKIVVISGDISEYKRKVKKLEKMAFYDYLTGLPNRRILLERLNQSMYTTDRTGKLTALLVLDCDNFKQVNDSFGHDIGDEVIKEFSKRVRRTIRDTDTLSRVGGDEFTVVIPEIMDKQQVFDISNRILEAVHAPMEIKDHVLHLTTSIGISFYPFHGKEMAELLKKADENLYTSKSLGGNTFSY